MSRAHNRERSVVEGAQDTNEAPRPAVGERSLSLGLGGEIVRLADARRVELVRSESETGDEERYCSRRRSRRLALRLADTRTGALIGA
jgi:hypothetical protein